MLINKNLSEATLEDLKIAHELEKYKVEVHPDSTVGTLIYQHLNSKPGFIKHKRSSDKKMQAEELYLEAIHKVVSKGAPLEIFISTFSPKVTNPNITNGHVYPDMADLLTLIHLHSVAKGIREIYDYGFRFIIGYRGHIYKEFFNWKEKDVDKSYQQLLKLTKIAEKIVGIRNVVQLVDTKDLIEAEGEDYQIRLELEKERIKNEYKIGVPLVVRKIDAWINDFKHVIDINQFSSTRELDSFLHKHAIHFRAMKNIEYKGGKHDLGICNSFPNILLATIRGLDEKISIQISPFFHLHSHQRLIALTKDLTWKTMKWNEMQELVSEFEPVYVKDFEHPFYYMEK
jgi:hypothetical protein